MATDIRKSLKKYVQIFSEAKEKNANEANTVTRIQSFFVEVLGYDLFSDVIREQRIQARFADLEIKVDDAVKLIVEAKAAGEPLKDRHVDQAKLYAAESNVKWVLLTNGTNWNLYYLAANEPLDFDTVFKVDLENDEIGASAQLLGLLHKKALRVGEHETYRKKQVALSPLSVGKALFTEAVLDVIRREIRRDGGHIIDEEDLAQSLHEMFLPDVREKMGAIRIRHRSKVRISAIPATRFGALPATLSVVTPPVWRSGAELFGC